MGSEHALDGPAMSWRIVRVQDRERTAVDDMVILEEPLEVVLNGQPIAVLMRMPGQEKELAAGFCLSEGYVRDAREILLIHHCGRGHPAPEVEEDTSFDSRNRVTIRIAPESMRRSRGDEVVRLIRSGCGAAEAAALSDTLPVIGGKLTVPSSILLDLGRTMHEGQTIHRQVGGTHAAALFQRDGQAITITEDIGRHNAVDKAIGYCLLRGIDLSDKIMVTSGRTSYEMASKALRAGIPVIASVSAPTALAVQLAENGGLTLIGYLRGRHMNVYTHPERVRDA